MTCALSSADRVPGYEPVGQRFESSRARQQEVLCRKTKDFFFSLNSFTPNTPHAPCGAFHVLPPLA